MDQPPPRWRLLGTAANLHGMTHHTLSCSALLADEDYEELMRVLKNNFEAAEVGQLVGPYSVHHIMKVDSFRVGIILDCPDELDLYAVDQTDAGAVKLFITQLLAVLNGPLVEGDHVAKPGAASDSAR